MIRKEKWKIFLLCGGALACVLGFTMDQLLPGILVAQFFWLAAFSLAGRENDHILPSHWKPIVDENKDAL